MRSRQSFVGVAIAPAAALALGVWAEFADLGPPLLLAVAGPAILISTLSAAYLASGLARPFVVLLLGVAIGVLTFGLTEGSYLAIHLSRGGTLNFEGADSQGAMAAALLGIHAGVGAVVGLAIGCGLALVLYAARALGGPASPRSA